jgi:uncharacterized protein (DUF2141 family)
MLDVLHMSNCQDFSLRITVVMRKLILVSWAVLALAFGSGTSFAADDVNLHVKIDNLKNSKGKLVVALFDNSDDFLKNTIDQKIIDINENLVGEVDFKITSPGSYAVVAFHDRNSNGDLDVAVIIPREPYGFSNDARSMFGPPKFRKASFDITDSDLEIEFGVR